MHRRAGKYFETNERDILKASRHYLRAKLPKRAAKLVTDDVWQLINQGQVRALRLVLEMFTDDGLDPILWMKVNLARGQVYAFVGEAKLARDAYQEAYSRSSSIPDSPLANDLRARVCYGMGDLLKNSAPPEALDWLNRGLAESDGISNLERANLLIKIGAVHARMGKFEEALGTLEKGLALLPNQPTQTRAGAYINLGMVYGAQGNPQRAIEFLQQGLEISQRLHDYFQLLIVQGNLGIAKKIFGDWEGASANFQEALALAEKLGSVSEQARMENSLGLLLTLQGRDELAMTHLTRALDLARKHNLKAHLIHTLTSLAELQIRQANWNVAENSHIEAQQLAMSVNAKHQLPEIFTGQAQVELAKGNVQAALELTEKAVNLAHEQRLHVEEGKALRVLGVIMLSNGQRAESANVLQHSLSLLLDRDMYEAARTKLYWAHALISSAEKKQGVELLQDAQKTFARLGAKQDLEIVKNYRSNAESVKRNEC
jgi:tetratricopeptide (TPR) repeat protein